MTTTLDGSLELPASLGGRLRLTLKSTLAAFARTLYPPSANHFLNDRRQLRATLLVCLEFARQQSCSRRSALSRRRPVASFLNVYHVAPTPDRCTETSSGSCANSRGPCLVPWVHARPLHHLPDGDLSRTPPPGTRKFNFALDAVRSKIPTIG